MYILAEASPTASAASSRAPAACPAGGIVIFIWAVYVGSKHYATTARHHCHRPLNRPRTGQYTGTLSIVFVSNICCPDSKLPR